MAIRRKKQSQETAAAESFGYQSIVSLIATRLDLRASHETMQAAGLAPMLATRYLDLAVAVAARQVLGQMADRVELPSSYDAKIDIPGLSSNFDECLITAELVGVYTQEPTAAALLGPLAPDVVAINQAFQQHAEGLLRLGPPTIGDGSQVGFARSTFGDEGVVRAAANWPALA